jgi:hypothetical protein
LEVKVMKRYITALLCCIVLAQSAVAALNKNFYSDGTIEAGQEWNGVGIYDTPPSHTTVNMTGGTVWSLGTYNASTLNISGGYVTGSLNVIYQSTANISGSANLSNVSGNAAGTINVFDGTIGILDAVGSTVNFYGGDITMYLWAHANATVNIFGKDLVKTHSGGTFGDGQITGLWLGGSAFTINMEDAGTYSRVNLVATPEPVTLLLFGAGIPLFRQFRKLA